MLTVILAPPEVYIKFLTTRAYDSVNSAEFH